MVRLELGLGFAAIPFGISFNPTMVRLERYYGAFVHEDEILFQSHYGAIGTDNTVNSFLAAPQFQSHYGAIGTWKAVSGELIKESFNPTMVRLELCRSRFRGGFFFVSIPLWCDWNRHADFPFLLRFFSAFQSHYGAIGTLIAVQMAVVVSLVSIPLWCDWNVNAVHTPSVVD